ncbi:MAG: hypothetical protein KDN05_00810 [Verrucomicrobiae bacterium]|nr:hypothetical protein [Verrucomicrobiae bacterium]
MKTLVFPAVAVGCAFGPFCALAQTNFTDADATDSLISNPLNWDNGLPTGGSNPGTLGIHANSNTGSTSPLDGYDITHTDGTLTPSGATVFYLGTGSYTVDGAGGGSPQVSNWRGLNVGAGGSFTLVDGVADFSTNANTDTLINGSLSVQGGDFTVARRLLVSNNGTITIEGGTVTTANTTTGASIGGTSGGSTGDYFIHGGDIDFRFMQFGNANVDFFFSGTTAGNLTVENFGGFRHNPAHIDIDFAPGSLVSLTLTNPVAYDDPDGEDRFGWADDNLGPAWAEALWSDGRLSYNNDTVSGVDILGGGGTTVLTWAQAQVDLGDGSYFIYNSSTNTLSLGSGAPPVSNPFQITEFSPVAGEPGVWQVSLTGDASTGYVFRSSTTLDFSTASVMENLIPGVPAAGSIGGTSDSVVTTDGSGLATVRMTLTGNPSDFVRAETAP